MTEDNRDGGESHFHRGLMEACRLPVAMPNFLEAYTQTLCEVSCASVFQLYGMNIEAPCGVYSPHETSSTRFVLDHFEAVGLNRARGSFLEIGCGAGAIALRAAKLGWVTSAGDVDPVAVDAAQKNADSNNLKLDARVSDMFSAFAAQRFDVILFNQPFFHVGRPIKLEERTLSAPDGRLHVDFLARAKQHLRPGGSVVFSYSNCSDVGAFVQPGWNISLRAFDYDGTSNYIRALYIAKPTLDN